MTASTSPPFPSDDAIRSRLQLHGEWQQTAERLAYERHVRQECGTRGITISDGVLQSAFEQFRRERGLLAVDEFNGWLEMAGVSLDDLEEFLEAELLENELITAIVPDDELDRFLHGQPLAGIEVMAKQWTFPEQSIAEEVRWNCLETGRKVENYSPEGQDHLASDPVLITLREPTSWPEDVRRELLSLGDAESDSGGNRGMSRPVYGPFPWERQWHLIEVLSHRDRSGLPEFRAELRRELFAERVAQK